jgi:hypothetical protein
MCVGGSTTTLPGPGALSRGGSLINRASAGPLTVLARPPFVSFGFIGFRCAR